MIYKLNNNIIDTAARTLTRNGDDMPLTYTEFNLLIYLINNAGTALSKSQLLSDICGLRNCKSRSIDTHICTLRIMLDDQDGDIIITLPRYGYRLNEKRLTQKEK